MAMDEKLSEALAKAAAQERAASREKRAQVRPNQAWHAALAAERQADVARNWRATLRWVVEGKASRDAALEAFLSVYGTTDQATVTDGNRSRTLMFLPVEVARCILSPPLAPPLLEAYRVWARGAADPEAVAAQSAATARLAGLVPRLARAEENARATRQHAEEAETSLAALRLANAAKLAGFYEDNGWIRRKLSPEGREQYQTFRQALESEEQQVALVAATARAAAELADGEALFARDEVRAARAELDRLQARVARAELDLIQPLGLEPTAGLPLSLVTVPAGRFWMGSADFGNQTRPEEIPLRRVELSAPYDISPWPVTQALYLAVTGENPSRGPLNALAPVTRVSWYDACRFCNALSERCGLERAYHLDEVSLKVVWRRRMNGFRLPTEAEWERAARAGDSYDYAGDEVLDRVGWYADNSSGVPRPVAGRRPNRLGLCDLSGNVWEWCYDGYAPDQYRRSEPRDPVGPDDAPTRVMRGGSVANAAERCRVAARSDARPEGQDVFLGFRVVRGTA